MDAPPFEGWAYGDDATGEQKWPHGESNGQEASRERQMTTTMRKQHSMESHERGGPTAMYMMRLPQIRC